MTLPNNYCQLKLSKVVWVKQENLLEFYLNLLEICLAVFVDTLYQ